MNVVDVQPQDITLELAETIIDEALAVGRAMNAQLLSVAVVDAGGHLVSFKRENRSGILRFDVAFGKAWACLAFGRPSRAYQSLAKERPEFITALVAASGGRFVPVPGGVLIRNSSGKLLGAVGISGDTAEADETCCIAGVTAARLQPEPAAPAG